MFPSILKLGRSKGGSSPKSVPPSPTPPPIGWSPSLGSANAAYPLQSGLAQQGSSTQQQQQQQQQRLRSPGHPQDEHFPGGFLRVDTNFTNATATSASPTSLTGSSSVGSHTRPNGAAQQPPPVSPRNVDSDECYAWFVTVDQDENGEVSPEELRSALLNDGGMSFSSRTVEHLMGIFDLDGNGVIGVEEFEPLWRYIAQWQQMFTSFDVDQDGKIDANELGRALAFYKLEVGPPVLNMLVKKYGITPPPNKRLDYPPHVQLDLDHFVCACIVVRQMCELYDKCTGGPGGPGQRQSRVSRDEFLEAVISLP